MTPFEPPVPVLEPAVQEIVDMTEDPPYIFDIGPIEGRKMIEGWQSGEIEKPDVDLEDTTIPGGPEGTVRVRIMRPKGATGLLPGIVYVHGTGWVYGSKVTHDRLIREITVGTGASVVFVDFTLAPEAQYPTQIEECYAAAAWVAEHGAEKGLDGTRLAIAGDSVGGNMTAVVTLMAKERSGPRFAAQVLSYSAIDPGFDTPSYEQFAEGWFLRRDAMQWFWDMYMPNHADRDKITAAPLRASLEQLSGLPPALIITAEADVLRDEAEAYGRKLREAGVPVTAVRYQGTVSGFLMLNSLRGTEAADAAIAQVIYYLRKALNATS